MNEILRSARYSQALRPKPGSPCHQAPCEAETANQSMKPMVRHARCLDQLNHHIGDPTIAPFHDRLAAARHVKQRGRRRGPSKTRPERVRLRLSVWSSFHLAWLVPERTGMRL